MTKIGGPNAAHPDLVTQKQLRQEYYILEKNMARFTAALELAEQFDAEQTHKGREWEAEHEQVNQQALTDVRERIFENGERLTEASVLQLLTKSPEAVAKMHPASLLHLNALGLTLTERRALHVHLREAAQIWKSLDQAQEAAAITKRKIAWYGTLETALKRALAA